MRRKKPPMRVGETRLVKRRIRGKLKLVYVTKLPRGRYRVRMAKPSRKAKAGHFNLGPSWKRDRRGYNPRERHEVKYLRAHPGRIRG